MTSRQRRQRRARQEVAALKREAKMASFNDIWNLETLVHQQMQMQQRFRVLQQMGPANGWWTSHDVPIKGTGKQANPMPPRKVEAVPLSELKEGLEQGGPERVLEFVR